MPKTRYNTEKLVELFHKKKVATLVDLKTAIGTNVKMTVFRKLKELSYRASYSHAGKYYMLNETANYNEYGLWNYNQVYFSKYGSLLNTIEILVSGSESGYFACELQRILKVRVYMPLLKLFSEGNLVRKQIVNDYLYLLPEKQETQLSNRKQRIEASILEDSQNRAYEFYSPQIKESLLNFLSFLNEKQKRLYLGFESMKLGYGGDTIMSKITGMDTKTIGKGRQELQLNQITPDRIREAGGGRKSIKKTKVLKVIEQIMTNTTAGNPMSLWQIQAP